jgi:O-antigen/teichoic acid export membrane protein
MKTFLSNFVARSGNRVLIATILSRILSFMASWVALQLISNQKLGVVLFSYNIIVFILPFSGLGLYHGLIRYAPLLKSTKEKTHLFHYVLNKGVLISILIALGVSFLSLLIPFKTGYSSSYLAVLAFLIVPDYVFQVLKIQFRILHDNRSFAQAEVVYNLILFITVCLLSFLFEEKGYTIALLIPAIITSLIFIPKLKPSFSNIPKPQVVTPTFWKYGFFASLTSVVSQLLIAVDILIIGLLITNATAVTTYRYISIIPLSLMFLPQAVMNTDFVHLTENIFDKKNTYTYIKNYISMFAMISIFGLIFTWFFSKEILSFFDENFKPFDTSFFVLMMGTSSILIFRGLFGNLLCSIGKINANLYISSIAILLNCCGNFYLIPKFGIKGAAITSASIMWFTSLASTFAFFSLYPSFLKRR